MDWKRFVTIYSHCILVSVAIGALCAFAFFPLVLMNGFAYDAPGSTGMFGGESVAEIYGAVAHSLGWPGRFIAWATGLTSKTAQIFTEFMVSWLFWPAVVALPIYRMTDYRKDGS